MPTQRHQILPRRPVVTNDGNGPDKAGMEHHTNARFRKSSDGRTSPGIIVRLLKLSLVAAFPCAIFNYYQQIMWYNTQSEAYHYPIPPPSLQLDIMEERRLSHYAKFGEVPEEMLESIPTDIKILPMNGTWTKKSWKKSRKELHGNKDKMICHLFADNQTAPIHSQPISENSSPYRVVARPISLVDAKKHPRYNMTDGVGNEFLAYNVARELGIHRIPTQTIIASDASPMNVQSLLRGVHMTFMDEWTNCLPNTKMLNDTGVVVDIGKEKENYVIGLNFVHANTQAVWKLCFRRNATHYGQVWGQYCLQHEPTIRKCRQEEIAQLLEMAMFDAIIYNRDRMETGSMSNNVHWLWPPTAADGDKPSLTTDDPLQLVWIDHDHKTFTEETKFKKRMARFFERTCIFPESLLRRLFHPGDRRRLSVRVQERLMPKLWATFNKTEGRQSAEERAQTVAQKLKVVDTQFSFLRKVVIGCEKKHNPQGFVDVMAFSDMHSSR